MALFCLGDYDSAGLSAVRALARYFVRQLFPVDARSGDVVYRRSPTYSSALYRFAAGEASVPVSQLPGVTDAARGRTGTPREAVT